MEFKMYIPAKRPETMSFEDYKILQKEFKKQLKHYKKGTLWFESLKVEKRETSTGDPITVIIPETYIKGKNDPRSPESV